MDSTHKDAPPDGVAEARATARINLFMAATLHAADGAHPAKIRDLSAVGAQLESMFIPEVGSVITLARGSMKVRGKVTWRAGRRFGLQFASQISVPEWMANPLSRQQQRVDQVVAAVKEGSVPHEIPPEHTDFTTTLIAEDLTRVSQLLEILGDALAGDQTIVTKHGIPLQNLDIALQTLVTLADMIAPEGAERGKNLERLAELRISCAEALRSKR
jgi:hypothetical protein